MNITIKKMETEDEIRGKGYVQWKSWQEAYKGLADQSWLDSMTLEKCTQMAYKSYRAFQWPDSILVAKDGEKVIGFTAQGAYRDDIMKDAGEVFSVYVLAEYYGKNVGYELMQAALLQISQFRQVALWVLAENGRAIRFYEKCGFLFDGAEQTTMLGTEKIERRMVLKNNIKNKN